MPNPRICWPLEIDTSNNAVRVERDRSGVTTWSATLTSGTYNTPEELAAEIVEQLLGESAPIDDVVFTPSGRTRFVFQSEADDVFTLVWSNSAATKGLAVLLGFAVDVATAADTEATATGVVVNLQGDYQHQNAWYPETPANVGQEPRPVYARDTSTTLDSHKLLTWGQTVVRTVSFTALPHWKVFTADEGDHVNEAAERLWGNGGAIVTYSPDVTDPGTNAAVYGLDRDTAREFTPEPVPGGSRRFGLSLSFVKSEYEE